MPLPPDYLNHLLSIIQARRNASAEESYVARLFVKGTPKIAQKVGEEAVEVVIAALKDDRQEIIKESADLLFHWLILLADAGITPDEVLYEIHRREGISGLMEKASRQKE